MSNTIEKSVIGALLIEPDSISGIYEQIKPEMFGDLFCRSVYTEIVRAYDVGKSISLEELAQKLQSEGQTQEYIVQELRGIIPTVESYRIKSYADALESDYKTRRLNELLSHVVPVAGCIDEQINGLLQDLEALKESDTVKIHGLGEVVDTVSGNYFTDPEQSILYTGLPKLDDTLGGLEGGDVIVIGARPAVGKSAFATQIAMNLAKSKKQVALYNLEMSDKQVYERLLSRNSGIGLTRIRRATDL